MYTYSVFCEAPTIFRSFRQVRRKVVGVFLFLAPGTFQSSDPGLTPSVPAIYSECLMAHPAVRLAYAASLSSIATAEKLCNRQEYTCFTLI